MCACVRGSAGEAAPETEGLMAELKAAHPARLYGSSGCETWSISFSPAGSRFAWSMGHGRVKILSWPLTGAVEGGREETTLDCRQVVWALAFGPRPSRQSGGEPELLLATGLNSGDILVWLVSTGSLLSTLSGHQAVVRDLLFTPDGRLTLVSASRDKSLRVWDLSKKGADPRVLRGPDSWIFRCSVSPDSSVLTSVCNLDSKVFLWSLRSYTFMRHLVYEQPRSMVSCDFSPDGGLLAVGSHHSSSGWWLDLWDPYTAHLLTRVRACEACSSPGENLLTSLSFSPVGLMLALKDYRALQVWDVEADQLITDTDHERSAGVCCTFHPHGGVVATGCRDGHVKFWKVPRRVPELRQLCRAALRLSVSTYQLQPLPLPRGILDFLTYRNLPQVKTLCCRRHHHHHHHTLI